MKKIFAVIVLCFAFLCHVKANPVFKIDHTGNKQVRIPVKGTNQWINMYYYSLTTGNTDAFCLDPNLSSGISGYFEPGLEESHTKNLYNYYLTTSDKEFPRNLIRMGQNYSDEDLDNDNKYLNMSTALRMYWFTVGMNVAKGKHYYGFNEALYDIFKDYHDYDLEGDSYKIYFDNPYNSSDKSDGFTYENGFWEAKTMAIDENKGYPGLIKQDDGTYKFNAMYKTNIRSGGFTCDTVDYDTDKFKCEVLKKDDEIIANKSVDYLHLQTLDDVTLDSDYLQSLQFKIKYYDNREANNFWITYVQGTSGHYDASTSGVANQRMYVIEKVPGELTISIGTQTPPPSDEPKKESGDKYCKIISKTVNCSGNYSISDDFDCVFNTDNINKIVSDNSSDSSKHKYTTTSEANEYCQIACAEKISFTFPTRINNTVAGTYYTLKNNVITSTGTRECRATLAMDKFNNRVTNSSGQTNDQINNSILHFDKNTTLYKDDSSYSYVEQNKALTALYNDISDSYYPNESTNSCCDSDEYGCNKYTHKISLTFNNMEFTQTTCGYKKVNIENISYNNSYSLESFKNDVGEAISKTSQAIGNETAELKKCTDNFNDDKTNAIEKNYDFNPIITFNYKEPYNNFFEAKAFEHNINAEVTTNTNASFKKLDDINYNNYSNGKLIPQKNNNLYGLSGNGIESISATVTKEYKAYTSPLKNNIYASIPDGTIVIKDSNGNYKYSDGTISKNTLTQQLYEIDEDIYPIGLATKEGKYEYSYTIYKVGDKTINSSNNSDLGRFDKDVKEKNRKYYCNYTVIKDITTCEDKENCNNKPTFYYRNVSLTNINPNNRQLGKNWTNEKGKKTLEEIKKQGEEAYVKPEYSFTLTPENMQKIKQYNKEKEENSNGYADFNMTKVNSDDLTEGIWYKSNFIWENTCNQCFTNNSKKTTFKKWEDSSKLSGTGPAWK